jgi:hypothetical protein
MNRADATETKWCVAHLTWWSSAARPRRTLVMISRAGACHTKGCGSSFQCEVHTSIASTSASTLVKVPFLRRRFVSWANQPSTRLSHDALVGVK